MTANTDSMRYSSPTPTVSRPASSSLNGMGAGGFPPVFGGGDWPLPRHGQPLAHGGGEAVEDPQQLLRRSGAPPLRTDHAALPSSARTLSRANTDSTAMPFADRRRAVAGQQLAERYGFLSHRTRPRHAHGRGRYSLAPGRGRQSRDRIAQGGGSTTGSAIGAYADRPAYAEWTTTEPLLRPTKSEPERRRVAI